MIARLRADARLLPYLALAIVAFGLIARDNATLVQAGTYGAIFAVAAIGLSMLLGNVAQISIGQAGFFGVGAYAAADLSVNHGWAFAPAAAIGTATAALVGLVLGFIALRFRGHYLAMATLAFGLIVAAVFRELKEFGGVSGIQNIPYPVFGRLTINGIAAYWFTWALVAVAAVLTLNVLRGKTGRAFEAIRNDELAAEVVGVPTRRYKIVAFTYAGALAGLAGTVYSAILGVIVPEAIGVPLSIDFLLMVVLGGMGGVGGPIVGAALIGVINLYGHAWENWREVAYGGLVIAIVIAFPGGVAGPLRKPRPQKKVLGNTFERGAPAIALVAADASGAAAPLRVQELTKRFGGLLAVDRVSFALEARKLTSLIGPNGAGKTTLFNGICGVGRLTTGRVYVGEIETTGWQPHRIAALGVSRTFQNARLFGEMTVLENVVAGAFGNERSTFLDDLLALPSGRRAERQANELARAAIVRLGLEPLMDRAAKDLPFGDRRRVELARALAARPRILLLDEPAAGLNARERSRLHDDLAALREAGMTMLLIEHDMRLVMSISDRVMVLKFGVKIADGTPGAVRNDPAVIAAYLGTSG